MEQVSLAINTSITGHRYKYHQLSIQVTGFCNNNSPIIRSYKKYIHTSNILITRTLYRKLSLLSFSPSFIATVSFYSPDKTKLGYTESISSCTL